MRTARIVTLGTLGAACALVACQDGLLHPAAPRAASLSMAVALRSTAGGAPEAYDRADGATIRFSADGEVRRTETLPFSPSGSETVLRVDVPLRQISEQMTVDLELESAGQPLFRGSTNATFSAGATSSVSFSLTPVIAAVTCAGAPLQFGTYGRTQPLTAAALFATGDTVAGAPIGWSVSDARVASVTSDGVVAALSDGDASVTCASGDVSGSRAVKVFAAVNRIDLAPLTATLLVGDTLRVVPTLRDSAAHAITAPRTITWSTTDATVATVDSSGLARALAAGAVRITAASGSAIGTASISVGQAPDVATLPATNVTASGATFNGSVNPHGSATQAWFQYDTSSTLATFSETAPQSVGSGTTATGVSTTTANLQPITTYFYRVVASNNTGKNVGSILSFRTGGAPPTLGTTSGVITFTCGLACFTFTTMSAEVSPNGLRTTVWFEYSTDSTFSSYSATPAQSAGSGTTYLTISASAGGFVYFRAVAQNVLGIVRSDIMTPTGG